MDIFLFSDLPSNNFNKIALAIIIINIINDYNHLHIYNYLNNISLAKKVHLSFSVTFTGMKFFGQPNNFINNDLSNTLLNCLHVIFSTC